MTFLAIWPYIKDELLWCVRYFVNRRRTGKFGEKFMLYTEFFIFVMYRPTSIVIGKKLIDVSDLVRLKKTQSLR